MSDSWPSARRWVVAGFGLVVLADLLNVIQLAREGLFGGGSTREQVEIVVSLAATAMSLVAWWWLSGIETTGPDRRLVARGFLAIAYQQVLFAVLSVLSLTTSGPFYSLIRWSWGLQGAGALVVAAGLVGLTAGRRAREGAGGDEDWPEGIDDPEVEAESEGEPA